MAGEPNYAHMRTHGEDDEVIGWSGRKPKACMTCAMAHGEPPWADNPLKSYCIAFPREMGMRKPPDVYYDGADCLRYVEDRNGSI